MRLGLQVSRFTWPGGDAAIGPTFAAMAKRAEAAGFASLWVMDHFFQIGINGPAEEPMLEGYSALTFAAALTSRLKLGTMVTGVTYRYPGVLVKTVTNLDVLSGGRAYLGIGAAWNEREHRALGVPFPPLGERFERLEEVLQIARQMWTGESTESAETKPYDGRHYHLTETLCRPLPIQKPHPPILVGGSGEQKTLRLVAKYADACNIFDSPQLPHKLAVLRGHCEAEGRPYAEIEKTVLTRVNPSRDGAAGTMSPNQVIDTFGRLADLGVDQGIFSLPNVADPDAFEVFAERIVPEAAKLVVAGRE